MRRYFEHLHRQEPHKKREFSAHAAAGVTLLVFLVWVSTLGVRLSQTGVSNPIANTDAASLVAATAQAGQAFQNQMQSISQSGSTDTSGNLVAPAAAEAPQTAPATIIGGTDNTPTIIVSTTTDQSGAGYGQ